MSRVPSRAQSRAASRAPSRAPTRAASLTPYSRDQLEISIDNAADMDDLLARMREVQRRQQQRSVPPSSSPAVPLHATMRRNAVPQSSPDVPLMTHRGRSRSIHNDRSPTGKLNFLPGAQQPHSSNWISYSGSRASQASYSSP